MKHSIPFTAIFIALVICTTFILGIYFYEKFLVKENQIAQFHSAAKGILAAETDINLIVSGIEATPELKHFVFFFDRSPGNEKHIERPS